MTFDVLRLDEGNVKRETFRFTLTADLTLILMEHKVETRRHELAMFQVASLWKWPGLAGEHPPLILILSKKLNRRL